LLGGRDWSLRSWKGEEGGFSRFVEKLWMGNGEGEVPGKEEWGGARNRTGGWYFCFGLGVDFPHLGGDVVGIECVYFGVAICSA